MAYLLVSSALPYIAFVGKDIVAFNFAAAGVVMAVLAVVCYALLYVNSVERVEVPVKPKSEQQSFGKLMASLLRNRALLAIVVAALLLLLGNLFTASWRPSCGWTTSATARCRAP